MTVVSLNLDCKIRVVVKFKGDEKVNKHAVSTALTQV